MSIDHLDRTSSATPHTGAFDSYAGGLASGGGAGGGTSSWRSHPPPPPPPPRPPPPPPPRPTAAAEGREGAAELAASRPGSSSSLGPPGLGGSPYPAVTTAPGGSAGLPAELLSRSSSQSSLQGWGSAGAKPEGWGAVPAVPAAPAVLAWAPLVAWTQDAPLSDQTAAARPWRAQWPLAVSSRSVSVRGLPLRVTAQQVLALTERVAQATAVSMECPVSGWAAMHVHVLCVCVYTSAFLGQQ
jgi:hypothetical protein